MREILFRGIIKSDNSRYKRGQWAVGDLVRLQDGNDGKPHIYGCGEVLSETVGQFTGLIDKNGKKIFEGDIFKGKVIEGKLVNYVFWYDEEERGFVYGSSYKKGYKMSLASYALSVKEFEVIGHIHDNPELLKSEVDTE